MIHTHPIKTDTEIEKAVAAGVNAFVVDNVDELWKLILIGTRSEGVAFVFYRPGRPNRFKS